MESRFTPQIELKEQFLGVMDTPEMWSRPFYFWSFFLFAHLGVACVCDPDDRFNLPLAHVRWLPHNLKTVQYADRSSRFDITSQALHSIQGERYKAR
jgi:hypothetical protein